MSGGRLPIVVATGASVGTLAAYLLAGGASYQPLAVADPCQPRPLAVLAERGILEGIVLSGLDGAACDLGVSREELTAALADDATLAAFASENGISEDGVDDAVRAGLLRAIDDAEEQGRLSEPVVSIVRVAAENAPIAALLDAFRAIPGDPTLTDVISGLGQVGIGVDDLEQLGGDGIETLRGLLDQALGG